MSQQVVPSFFNPTVTECQLSILKQTYKTCGPEDNSLDHSVARRMMHTSGSRHFPAGWLIIRQINKTKTKTVAVQEAHFFGKEQKTTKLVLAEDNQTSATSRP